MQSFSGPSLALGLALLLGACGSDSDVLPPEEPLPALMGIGVSPNYSVLPVGEVLQFRATGYYDDLTTRELTDIVDWQSWNSEVLEITEALDWEGKAIGLEPGQSRVRAVHEEIVSNEVHVTVTDAELVQLTVSPSSVVLEPGDSVQLVAEAAFSDGSHGEVTGSVQWMTDDPFVASVWPDGELVGESSGQTAVLARWGDGGEPGSEAFTEVTVVAPGVGIPPANLQIRDFSSTAVDDTGHWTVTIENVGGRAASEFWVDLWLDRSGPPPAPPTMGDTYGVVSVLGAGESVTLSLTLEGLPEGSHDSWVLVDSLGVVDEGSSGESDNVEGPLSLQVEAPPEDDPDIEDPPVSGTPDIQVLWLEGFTVPSPDAVFYFIDLQNLGDAATGPFELAVYGDQAAQPESSAVADDLVEVSSLEPGEIAYLTAEIPGVVTSDWSSWVLADPANTVEESDEGNNALGAIVSP